MRTVWPDSLSGGRPLVAVGGSEKDGKTLWRMPLHAAIKTSPMTYSVDGRQYVTLAVGSALMTFGLGN